MPNPVDRTQTDIRRTFRAILTGVAQQTSNIHRNKPTVPSETRNVGNPYARDVFFKNTNILEIAAQIMVGRSERKVNDYANALYNKYVEQPAQRIRDPFHRLKFSSREAEGLFRMALNVPFENAEQVHAYHRMLLQHGIRKLCLVDMTRGNIVLEDQAVVVNKLQRRFNYWSGKLDKLTVYLEARIANRAKSGRSVLLEQLQNHSTFSKIWQALEHFQARILDDLERASEDRILGEIWNDFRFNDDALNRKYKFGKYCPTRTTSVARSSEDVSIPNDVMHSETVLATPTTSRNAQRVFCPPESQTEPEDVWVATQHDHPCRPSDRVFSHKETQTVVETRSVATQHDHRCRPAERVLSHKETQTEPACRLVGTQQNHGANENITTTVIAVTAAPGDNAPVVPLAEPYTLEDIKGKTNVYELLTTLYTDKFKKTLGVSQKELAVKRYYNLHRNLFLAGKLPNSLRLLTTEEREALQHPSNTQSPLLQQPSCSRDGTEQRSSAIVHTGTEPAPSSAELNAMFNSPASAAPETIPSSAELNPIFNSSASPTPERVHSSAVLNTVSNSPASATTETIPSTAELRTVSNSSAPAVSETIPEKQPKKNVAPVRKRPIVYDSDLSNSDDSSIVQSAPTCKRQRAVTYLEDSITGISEQINRGSPAPVSTSQPVDTQSSLQFEPLVCSTQNIDQELAPYTPGIVTQNEPESQEPNPSPSEANTTSVTLVHLPPAIPTSMNQLPPETPVVDLLSSESPTLVKHEPQEQLPGNYSSYEGFVEVVPVDSPEVILIDDSTLFTEDDLIIYEPEEIVGPERIIPTSPTMSRINELFRFPQQNADYAGEPSSDIGTTGVVGHPTEDVEQL
ncbi:hypothetical protein AND_002799 [Anopheles darlingi]|uniref:Uncharacterized protein n=1 Tax=Anopheles darlingi TaxID=43151 RepID=W5JQ65_ANODA|nr:hypothetical protein AND_002799 [Anopheles darlingi]